MGKNSEEQICGQNFTEQNAKAHKEEECTSDWRNLEKIRRECRGRNAHSANCKLERHGGFSFFQIFPASLNNLHCPDTMDIGGGYE
jgi:hypothetical protein